MGAELNFAAFIGNGYMKKKLLLMFAIFNTVLLTASGMVFFIPGLSSVRSGISGVNLLERRLESELFMQASYLDILREIEEISAKVLPAISFFEQLAEISAQAEMLGLRQEVFIVYGPQLYFAHAGADGNIYESNVRAAYTGSLNSVLEFADMLASGVYNIRSLTIEIGETAHLNLEISFFGRAS